MSTISCDITQTRELASISSGVIARPRASAFPLLVKKYGLRPAMERSSSKTSPRAATPVAVTLVIRPSTSSNFVISSIFAAVSPACRSVPAMATLMVSAPMEVNESDSELLTPDTVVISAMTAVTPISTPRMVRNERSRLCMMLEMDIFTLSVNM